jgi:hypothetical protein
VVDARSGAWLRHLTLPEDTAEGLTSAALALGLAVTLYVGDERREAPCSRPSRQTDTAATRVMISGDEARLAAALPELLHRWGSGLRIERGSPGVIDARGRRRQGAALMLVARVTGVLPRV